MASPLSRRTSRPFTATVESEAIRLQRAVNLFTAQFEHERKEGLLLTEQIRACEEEIRRRQMSTRVLSSTTNPEEKKLRMQIQALEKQIRLFTDIIAETQTENRTMKQAINSYRREKRTQRTAIETMRGDLKDVGRMKEEKSCEREKHIGLDSIQRQQMANLRSKSAQHQFRQRAMISELESVIKEDRTLRDRFFRTIQDSFKTQMLRALETLDPSPVQTALMRKWHDRVIEAKHASDNYQRHVQVLEDGFERIRKMMGFHDNREVVTAVRKTQEQQANLYTHMNEVLAEIDDLESMITDVKGAIRSRQEITLNGEAKANSLLSLVTGQLNEVRSFCAAKQSHLIRVREVLCQVYTAIQSAEELFATPDFRTLSSRPTSDLDFITTDNVSSRLRELDTDVTALLMWVQYVNTGKNFFALAGLPKKRFDATLPGLRGLKLDIEEMEDARMPLNETEMRIKAQSVLHRRFQAERKSLAS